MDITKLIPDHQSPAGSRVLVTGGTTGIGRAVVIALAQLGARVITFGRHEDELESVLSEAEGDVYGLIADVSDLADVRRVFAEVDRRFDGLDILINNAAISGGSIVEQPLEEIERVVRTNIVGYLACAHEAVDRMRRQGSGRIVMVGSMSADLREPGGSTYVATKGAIQAFAESLRKTVNEDGIHVTLIEPGKVATDLVDKSHDQKKELVADEEMLRPEDIAAAIVLVLIQPPRTDIVSIALRPHLQVI